MPAGYTATIAERNSFGCSVELVLETPRGFEASPGQFVHVLCGGDGRILRRPFSVSVSHNGGLALLVRPVGEGSRWLCSREVGEELDFLGPLGRGFNINETRENVLIAGGAGIAPLRFLAMEMRKRGLRTLLCWGMDGGEDFGRLPDIIAEESGLYVSTRDGKRGFRGSVLELLDALEVDRNAAFYACGPREMLADLVRGLGDGELERTQVSVEERMACGVGACRGCAVPSARPGAPYLTACREGPVFFAHELDWERM